MYENNQREIPQCLGYETGRCQQAGGSRRAGRAMIIGGIETAREEITVVRWFAFCLRFRGEFGSGAIQRQVLHHRQSVLIVLVLEEGEEPTSKPQFVRAALGTEHGLLTVACDGWKGGRR